MQKFVFWCFSGTCKSLSLKGTDGGFFTFTDGAVDKTALCFLFLFTGFNNTWHHLNLSNSREPGQTLKCRLVCVHTRTHARTCAQFRWNKRTKSCAMIRNHKTAAGLSTIASHPLILQTTRPLKAAWKPHDWIRFLWLWGGFIYVAIIEFQRGK